jgi:hypothetical protein
MEKRIWIAGGHVTKTEPVDPTLTTADIQVRSGDPMSVAVFDGVWVRGQRSYDTYVIIDGVVRYHAPRQGLADSSFDEHERVGGGHLAT